ncbi:hypothetical protein HQ45_06160 [Porphyromonas crevioricanis]|nr:hypothetical protein HQ45_06160 [Porphyromonas crevioricanis]
MSALPPSGVLIFILWGKSKNSLLREILLTQEKNFALTGEKFDPLRMPMNRAFWRRDFLRNKPVKTTLKTAIFATSTKTFFYITDRTLLHISLSRA